MTLRQFANTRTFRITAATTGLAMLAQLWSPTVSFALTSGPAQPEASSFTPVEATNMVDLFTGDFNYNIHLLTVPGANGGYPINLGYSAGIGLEQEASWVGLGWNLNPGAVNRQMRGLPDDFKGDVVTKLRTSKPSYTVSLGVTKDVGGVEAFGLDKDQLTATRGISISYNNYTGTNLGVSTNFSAEFGKDIGDQQGFFANLGLSLDEQNGLGVSPGVSYAKIQNGKGNHFNFGASFSSRHGLTALHFDWSRSKADPASQIQQLGSSSEKDSDTQSSYSRQYTASGAGMSLSYSPLPPVSDFPRTGWSGQIEFNPGVIAAGVTNDYDIRGSYTTNALQTNTINYASYGYLHSQTSTSDEDLLDFQREKDVVATKSIKSLPLPIANSDVFSISGQGVGAVVRAYRSDVGLFADPKVVSRNKGGGVGFDADDGDSKKIGVNITINTTESESGAWPEAEVKTIPEYDFKTTDQHGYAVNPSEGYFDPFQFHVSGETVAQRYPENNFLYNDRPVQFEIASRSAPVIRNMLMDGDLRQPLNSTDNPYAKKRVKGIEYLTRKEAAFDPIAVGVDGANFATMAYGSNVHPIAHHLGSISTVNPDGRRYVFGQPVYNLYQRDATFSVNHSYNVTSNPNYQGPYATMTDYTAADNSLDNKKGQGHIYHGTVLPPYTHSYLLTAVLSSDYVDVDDNGPSQQDFGSWISLDYRQPFTASNPFYWRAPYTADNASGNNTANTASLNQGHFSNPDDDMASYTFGAREVFYLDKVESKTHMAVFHTSAREDGLPLQDDPINNSANGPVDATKKLEKLDRIELYKKATAPGGQDELIKTVHFSYSYDLCGNVANNSGAPSGEPHPVFSGQDANDNAGKLTLKKVWFTYGNNQSSGALSPYVFDYNEHNGTGINYVENPDYSLGDNDRWGNYQPDNPSSYPYLANHLHPYTNQQFDYNRDGTYDNSHGHSGTEDATLRNHHASVWNLKAITLPSGGKIALTYEQDDYAYVQDKPAMMLSRILNTGKSDGTLQNGRITENDTRIYFELKKPIISGAGDLDQLAAYFTGIEEMYFKTYQRLKKHTSESGHRLLGFPIAHEGFAYDYVEGYAEPDVSTSPGAYSGFGFDAASAITNEGVTCYTAAWFDLKAVPISDKAAIPAGTTHPFRKAGWQYLRLQRPELFNHPDGFGNIANILSLRKPLETAASTFTELYRMFRGYYRYAREAGYCHKIGMPDMGEHYPSFIRLNVPDQRKYGGGHRIAKVTISDNWQAMSGGNDFQYGTEYSYDLPDGTSSGVASYEPLIGGEEIPHHLPSRYQEDSFLMSRDNNLYVEEPLGESYFPSANVGYSRVTVRSLSYANVTKATSGFSVHEHYTARDFPVIIDRTRLAPLNYTVPLWTPFSGGALTKRTAHSMGYLVELNNMHGKQKSQATFANGVDPVTALPQAKTEYFFYETPEGTANGARKLDNRVPVLVADGHVVESDLGKTIENVVATRSTSTVTNSFQGKPNTSISNSILAVVPMLVPFIDDNDTRYRSVANVKVIRRNGVLKQVKTTVNGAINETNNLAYDGETGKAVLTSVTNSYKDPIYNYNFPAYFTHEGMRAAYHNLRAHVVPDGNGNIPAGATVLLRAGDLLMDDMGNRFWVEFVDPANGSAVVKDESDALVTTFNHALTVIRSGNRNQQDASAYSLVSLEDPLNARQFPLFALWNGLVAAATNPFSSVHQIIHCHNQQTEQVEFIDPTAPHLDHELWINPGDAQGPCHARIEFAVALPVDMHLYTLKKAGDKVYAFGPNGEQLIGDWVDTDYCYKECLDGVLNTQLVRLKDTWDYDYTDALVPFPITGAQGTVTATSMTDNPYRYGRSGIYRPEKNYLFYTQRVQQGNADPITVAPGTNTNVRKDGVFDKFFFYNWNTAEQNNYPWNARNEITQYSPYGWELENKDALGIPASALYGYDNLLPTAVGANNHYRELAFDGFEDYASTYPGPVGGHGHLEFALGTGGSPALSGTDGVAHTGEQSLKLGANTSAHYTVTVDDPANARFDPVIDTDNTYFISAWVRSEDAASLQVSHDGSGSMTVQLTASSDPLANSIEGWHRLEGTFNAPAAGNQLKIELIASSATAYFDDIRVQRMRSQMTSYVYDPVTLWLVAELDANNYATFYNYDEDGALVQVKKETVEGIQTITTNRSNTHRITP